MAKSESTTYIQTTAEKYGNASFVRDLIFENVRHKAPIKEYAQLYEEARRTDLEKTIGTVASQEGPREEFIPIFRHIRETWLQGWAEKIHQLLPFLFEDGLTYGYYEIEQRPKRGEKRNIGLMSVQFSELVEPKEKRLVAEVAFTEVRVSDFIEYYLPAIFSAFEFDVSDPKSKEYLWNYFKHAFYHEVGHTIYHILPKEIKTRFQNIYKRQGYVYSLREKGIIVWAPGSEWLRELFAEKFAMFVFPGSFYNERDSLSERERAFLEDVIAYLHENCN